MKGNSKMAKKQSVKTKTYRRYKVMVKKDNEVRSFIINSLEAAKKQAYYWRDCRGYPT